MLFVPIWRSVVHTFPTTTPKVFVPLWRHNVHSTPTITLMLSVPIWRPIVLTASNDHYHAPCSTTTVLDAAELLQLMPLKRVMDSNVVVIASCSESVGEFGCCSVSNWLEMIVKLQPHITWADQIDECPNEFINNIDLCGLQAYVMERCILLFLSH